MTPQEGKGALALSMEAAEKANSPLILANDPDADRLAVAERQSSGEWYMFTGNEIGALFAHWQWVNFQREHPDVPAEDVVMLASTVSSKMIGAMAKKEGFVFEETLTGFKWMGSRTAELREAGKHVIFSFEEAIGFCVGDVVKDKVRVG